MTLRPIANPSKLATIAIAGALVANLGFPVSNASAHDRRNWRAHHGHAGQWNQRQHRAYHNHRPNKKRHSNGDLIAAGIIGLAVGAIIASEASKNRKRNSYTYAQPYTPQPTYADPYATGYGYNQGAYDPGYVERRPLSDTPATSGPNVITYEDTISTEPWSPGWYDYCTRKYRSFNPKNGTFLGYDGQYHFCVAN